MRVKHGLRFEGNIHPLYETWKAIRRRCMSPERARYPDYGGRGIKLCPRWDDFAAFVADVGPRPSLDHTLDRINNDGDYEPSNVQWATKKAQARNRRDNKLTMQAAQDIRQLYASGLTQVALAKRFDCSRRLIVEILRGKKWLIE